MSKLWGGRFSKSTDPLVEKFTRSIQYDKKLAEYDCIGSLTHVDILKKAGLLTSLEHKKLHKGLNNILKGFKDGSIKIDESAQDEDIHSFIQNLLEKKIKRAAFKLHTCRSRNDQIVFDTKLYCLDQILISRDCVLDLRDSLFKLAKKNKKMYIPGYTHLQHAIPVYLPNYLMAYTGMLREDGRRLSNVFDSINLSMGAGALAGTPIQSKHYNSAVESLKDSYSLKPSFNSIYTVSDRDFIIETLSALSIIGMHLSRLSEDFIIWSTKEFDFVDIDEAFCTGSSLMPQKKNPDVLELIRGYSGRLYGNLMNVLVVMKGLPLSYNRDMQLDKEPLFDSFKIVQDALVLLSSLLKNIKFKEDSIRKQLDDECLYATDMADFLVGEGVPFKEAHTIIGRLINCKLTTGKKILEMTAEDLKQYHALLTPEILKKIINPKVSVDSKKSIKYDKNN